VTLDPTERKALVLATFVAASICFAPAQIISGVMLLVASFLLHRWDQAMLRKEAAAQPAATTAAPLGTPSGAPEPPEPPLATE
jgi:hypothetical protein